MKTQTTILAVLVLAACNRPEPATEQPQESQFEQELQALSESARNLAFRNAVRDTGARCERVERSAFQESYKGSGMWVAHCTDTGDFAVFVGRSGFAQVERCQDLATPAAPACKPLPKTVGQD